MRSEVIELNNKELKTAVVLWDIRFTKLPVNL